MVRLPSAPPPAGCVARSGIVQILKCEKLYHGEIGVINRTFGAARRTRVVDRQVAACSFEPANDVWRIDRADRRKTGQKSAKHGSSCDCRVPVAHLLVALRQPPIDRARSASTLPNPFFRRRRAYVTLLTFFRWQRGYVVGVWPAM